MPLRFIAGAPDVNLFISSRLTYPEGVAGVMKPWHPYYVFEKQGHAVLVGEGPRTDEIERLWVKETDCYCWTTRNVVNIESAVPVYASPPLEGARQQPLIPAYTYPYRDPPAASATADGSHTLNRMRSLPLLQSASGWVCFVCPERREDGGYQLGWTRLSQATLGLAAKHPEEVE